MTDSGATRPEAGRVLSQVRSLAPSMTPAERRIADALLGDPALVVEKTISALAKLCRTSETTVVRFCRAAGFRGYPELRLALATELGRDAARHGTDRTPGTDITRDDTLAQLVKKVAYADARAIEDTVEELDLDQLERVVQAITSARRIALFGIGASAFAAQDLQHKLLRIDRTALAIGDPHLALGTAALLTAEDVAIGLSHGGETAETVACLRAARRRGATSVAVTNYPHSTLATEADLVLTTAGRETRFRSGAMASRIAQLALVDCLFLGVAQRSYDDTLEALQTTHRAVHSAPASEEN